MIKAGTLGLLIFSIGETQDLEQAKRLEIRQEGGEKWLASF